MTTLADIRSTVARRLRDSSNNVWTTGELDDLINQGIDALGDVYPKEIVQTVGTVSAGTLTYDASAFASIYRLDVYQDATYRGPVQHATGGGRDSGWEVHAGTLYLMPNLALPEDAVLEAFGYGRYLQLSADSTTTDLDPSGIWGVVAYCQAEAYGNLIADRVAFQQWQAQPGNTDVTAIGLAQIEGGARSRWEREKARLRRLRKLG